MDDLRIWDRALSQAEIVADMKSSAPDPLNLIGHWDFNERKGVHVLDKSAKKYTCRIYGNATRVKR
jgi:hypothetical protein